MRSRVSLRIAYVDDERAVRDGALERLRVEGRRRDDLHERSRPADVHAPHAGDVRRDRGELLDPGQAKSIRDCPALSGHDERCSG